MAGFSSKQTSIAAAAGIAGALICAAAFAEPFGYENGVPLPNFSSTEYGWLAVDDELKPMMQGPRPIGADPKHPYFGNQSGLQPTFRVSDTSNPVLTDWARQRMRPGNEEVIKGKYPYSFQANCMPGGIPGQLLGIFEPVYFAQTKDIVLMMWQRDHVARHIYMNREHSKTVKPSWYGESVGHYEGTWFVVDTIGLDPKAPMDNYRTPHSEKLHVVERYHLVDDGETLEAIVTMEDPVALTAPLTVYQHWRKIRLDMIEVSCSENNISYYGDKTAGPSSFAPTAAKADF